jgi:hypothetical protein
MATPEFQSNLARRTPSKDVDPITRSIAMIRTRSMSLLLALALTAVGIAVAQEQQIASPSPDPNVRGDSEILSKHVSREYQPPGMPAAAPTTQRSQYRTLLKQIEVPEDRKSYGDFCDFGFWSGTAYSGHTGLPPGYWVYLAPNWYIFQEDVTSHSPIAPLAPRPWGPEQATGAPDTWPNSGDLTTAWASATPDGQREWLELTYKDAVRPSAVLIYETYNPGAVDRVTTYDANGKEIELWSGTDPTPAGSEKGISVIPLHPDFDLTRIRIHLDSPKVAGWNEIDAVGLIDAAGTTHWAAGATASSTYADQGARSAGESIFDLGAGEKLDKSPRFWTGY